MISDRTGLYSVLLPLLNLILHTFLIIMIPFFIFGDVLECSMLLLLSKAQNKLCHPLGGHFILWIALLAL